jgi:hypothetical protein
MPQRRTFGTPNSIHLDSLSCKTIKKGGLMATEILGFTSKDARDEQYASWKTAGSAGLGKHSTHIDNNPQIVWAVTRYVPASVEPEGTPTKVLLPESGENEMISEGGNTNETIETQPEPVQPEVGSTPL